MHLGEVVHGTCDMSHGIGILDPCSCEIVEAAKTL